MAPDTATPVPGHGAPSAPARGIARPLTRIPHPNAQPASAPPEDHTAPGEAAAPGDAAAPTNAATASAEDYRDLAHPAADPVHHAAEQAPEAGPYRPVSLPVLTSCADLQHKMHILVDQAPHMIIVYALRDGTIRYTNTATTLLLGRRPDELMGASIFEVLTVPDNGAADPTDSEPDEPSLLPGEYPATLPDGSVHYLDVRSAPVIFDGIRCGYVVAWDVTARVERERDLIRQASYDELTGLPNAAHAFVYLEQSLRRLERSGTGCVAVILIDLDGFKAVNDTHGHQIGDVLLQETATRIRSTTRDTDLAARLHGDEFLVVQSVANPIHAAYVSERLRTTLANPTDIDGLTVKVSASVGVAVADPGSTDPHHLLQFADHRMYTDKQRRAHQR
ncbi:MAG: diguanylate cyclase domain-containing protein [Micromonosporaceae bacterium]